MTPASPPLPVQWSHAASTAHPVGVWLPKTAVRWLQHHSEDFWRRLNRYRGLATPAGVVLSASEDLLPWAPGAIYLCAHVHGQLWLASYCQLHVPKDWLLAALRAQLSRTTKRNTGGALLCLTQPKLVLALEGLGPVGEFELKAWCAQGEQ